MIRIKHVSRSPQLRATPSGSDPLASLTEQTIIRDVDIPLPTAKPTSASVGDSASCQCTRGNRR